MALPLVTVVRQVDAGSPEPELIEQAAALLGGGSLVVFPTETVYGLGALALDPAAVERIFQAKGRPANNPLIVHVANLAQARGLVRDWPADAQRLAERFWPGPLTLVLAKDPCVPDRVTAGGGTVALRMPAHPVALALLRKVGAPLAAPSANRSCHLSATTAGHAWKDLDGRVAMILDAGPTEFGVESTVVDLTGQVPRVLRPGSITAGQLTETLGRSVLGQPQSKPASLGQQAPGGARSSPVEVAASVEPLRSPGQLARHYSPRIPLELVEPGQSLGRVLHWVSLGCRVGWLRFSDDGPAGEGGELPAEWAERVERVRWPEPAEYARRMYGELHRFEDQGLDRIVVDFPPDLDAWQAVRDRLTRAAVPGP